MAIRTIHLLHHTHIDFGYTDLPSTMARLQREYTARALGMIAEHRRREEASRFRWTVEVAWVAAEYLEGASAREREGFAAAVRDGLLEVGALPFHPTGFTGAAEWEAIRERLAPAREVARPRVAILNDVNGLPWGLVPRLLDDGVRWLSTGLNTHGGRPPRGRPSFFRWEGPDGRSILVWLGYHYCEGYFFFHESEWRRGPIPHCWDAFFHPPEVGDIWRADEAGLEAASRVLERRLGELGGYRFEDLALQVTNMWRMDNDPPYGGLPGFVEAWNGSGREPRLRLSLFSDFFEAAEKDAAMAGVETLRGDWANWWADGGAAFPRENVAVAAAAEILGDLPRLGEACGAGALPGELVSGAWRGVALFGEHTADSHDAMASPAGELSLGHKAEKSALAFGALEGARCALAEVLRGAAAYVAGRRAGAVMAVNPGQGFRSGWIEIPAEALPEGTASLKNPETGEAFGLEVVAGPRWSPPCAGGGRFEMPDDTFGFRAVAYRAFLSRVPPGGAVRLLPSAEEAPERAPAWHWEWDEAAGRLVSLGRAKEDVWIGGGEVFGGLVVDEDPTFGARWYLTGLDGERVRAGRKRSRGEVQEYSRGRGPNGEVVRLVIGHPHCHRVEQEWRLHAGVGRVEVETTLWLKETFVPVCMALAFPFAGGMDGMAYTSLGLVTRVGRDQMPGCCGDYAWTEGWIAVGRGCTGLVLRCPGVPLAAFGALRAHEGTESREPERATVYSIFAMTHWNTNFPHLRPGKVTLRHAVDGAGVQSDRLYCFPSA